jgi:hypothetical protein
MISALAALLVTAQSEAAPETALVHSGVPRIQALADEEGVKADLQFEWHTVKMTLLDGDKVKIDAVTLFKNHSDKPATATVSLPVWIKGWSGNWGTKPTALWADEKVEPANTNPVDPVMTRFDGQLVRQTGRVYEYETTFRPQAMRSFKTSFTLPVQITGLDGVERQIGYMVPGKTKMDSLQMSFTYTQLQVFRVISQTPNWGWQVGPRGAFFKREPLNEEKPNLAKFRWYDGGFAR